MEYKPTTNKVGVVFWTATCMFCLAGVTSTYLANEIDLKGAGNPLTGFQPTALWTSETIGGALLFCCRGIRFRRKHLVLPFKHWYILVSDVFGNVLYWGGLGYVGSGLTTVMYSSIVVWTGIFSWLLYGKSISRVRWLSIFLIWGSISLSATGQIKSINNFYQALGIVFVSVSAISFGLQYVLVENLVISKVSPIESAFFFWPNMIVGLLWIGIFDGMFWNRYVMDPIREHDPDTSFKDIGMLLFFFLIAMGIHQLAFFHQVNEGTVAAVTAAVNKCVEAALIFVLSDIWYCPTHPWNQESVMDTQLAQCVNTWKMVGFVGTMLGILVYSLDGVLWGIDTNEGVLSVQSYKVLTNGE